MCCSTRQPLLPRLKLVITLRFLATGMTYHALSYSFHVAHNTISLFVPKVCAAIVEEYQAEVFDPPRTQVEWQCVVDSFADFWNIPHAWGA